MEPRTIYTHVKAIEQIADTAFAKVTLAGGFSFQTPMTAAPLIGTAMVLTIARKPVPLADAIFEAATGSAGVREAIG